MIEEAKLRWKELFQGAIVAVILGTVALIIGAILRTPPPPPKVTRYRCIITVHDEILCFEPGSNGAMFRPEKRFDEFVLEVPAKGEKK